MGPLDKEHEEFIDAALKSGVMKNDAIALVIIVSKLLQKPVLEVQDALMDANMGIQAGFRRLGKMIAEDTRGQGVDIEHPRQ